MNKVWNKTANGTRTTVYTCHQFLQYCDALIASLLEITALIDSLLRWEGKQDIKSKEAQ